MGTHSLRFLRDFLACVAGGFGGRESRAKTSGAAAGKMWREPRQSWQSRVNERLRLEEPSPHFSAASPLVLALVPGLPVSPPIKTASYAGYDFLANPGFF